MTDTFPAPSRLLLTTHAVAKWALRLVAGAWLFLGLIWLALHFVIVPRIDDLRPWLEAQASHTVGAVVHIGSISAQSNGLIPSVELRGVQVLDAEGQPALELSSVIAAVSPRSLVAGGLEQLYIESPVLDVQRKADGTIWIGGFALPASTQGDSVGADWLFSQPELVIRHGTVRWTDALRQAPPIELSDVDLVLRNRHFTHSLRINASPPAHWGERLSVQGVFTHPLLTLHAGRWQEWQGQWYTAFNRLDWAQLRPYLDVGVDVNQGRGSLRAWLDVKRTVITGATADLLLDDVHLGQGPQEQVLRRATGRLAVKQMAGGYEYSTQGLEFETAEGIRWPGGNARLALWDAQPEGRLQGSKLARGELSADRLDVAVLAHLAQRFPLDADWRTALQTYKPSGVVQTVQGSWSGSIEAPTSFALKGRVSRAAWSGQSGVSPGLQGLDVDFDFTQSAGKARFAMANGSVDLAGWFAEPVLPLVQLSGDLQWKKDGSRLNAAFSNLRFANADTQGEVQSLKWSNANASGAVLPGPGVLELQASLSRAELARVHRYLPLAMDQEVRDYLRDAIRGGTASAAKVVLKGDLRQFPFVQAKQGEFRVSAKLSNANYVYMPPYLLPKGGKPWPAFSQLSGELLLERSTLSLKGVRAVWGGSANQAGVPIERTEAQINNLYGASTVTVNAQGKGPLANALAVVNGSAIDDLLDHAVLRAVVTGAAEYRAKLDFTLADTQRMAINGAIVLQGNDVQVIPGTPRLAGARGQVNFSESAVAINGVVGQALGGEVRVDGTLTGFTGGGALTAASAANNAKSGANVLRLQGSASAQGLRQASELGPVATSLARYASGTTTYQATVALRAGSPEIVVSSNLVGLGLSLPPPFAKPAEGVVPLRLEVGAARTGSGAKSAELPGHSQLRLDWGRMASLSLVTDNAAGSGHVLRGAVSVGSPVAEPLAMPERGIAATVALDTLDVDDWTTWLDGVASSAYGGKKSDTSSIALLADYLPSTVNLRVRELGWGSQVLHKVAVNGSRTGRVWRAQVDATEFSGQIEYRQASVPDLVADSANTGRLYARLSRLTLGSSQAQDVENLLDEQPASIPALDVVVDDFELLGKKLGRLEVEAVNQTSVAQREPLREWRLKRLNLSMPAAVLNASGTWRLQPGTAGSTSMSVPGAASTSASSSRDRRRTALDFKLDINDSGDLLARFGMKDVIRQGRGKIEGQIEWQGSPISLDYPSLGGSFNANLEKGEFLKADPGIAKLLGVLSLQSLPRRLMLDFRDVFAEGFPFDFVRGDVEIAKGMARTNNLQMKGVTAAVLMDGSTDIAKETQSIKVVVVPELNAGSASLITATINPLVGLYSFLAQLVLRQPLIAASTQELYIDGTWLEPRVTKVERRPAAK